MYDTVSGVSTAGRAAGALRRAGFRAGFVVLRADEAAFFAIFFTAGLAALADFFTALAFGFAVALRFAEDAVIFATFFLAFAADFTVFLAADFAFFFAGFAISKLSLIGVVVRGVLSYIPIFFSTTIIAVNSKIIPCIALLLITGCSRLGTLTPTLLDQSEQKWKAAHFASYTLAVEMKGDRVEKERFDVVVRSGKITSLQRNGQRINPTPDQDYSMDGLFRVLHEEMDLAQRPALLGAPEGYSAYLMASFDPSNGRLLQYRRTVGGTSNTIDIRVTQFQPSL